MGNMTVVRGAGGSSDSGQHTPVESPDSLRSLAYARIIDLVSEGEIVGPADSTHPMTCVYLNETPVANADGTVNFNNVTVDYRTGTMTQTPLKGFDRTENEITVGVEFTYATAWVQDITNTDIDSVRVRLSVPQLVQTDPSNGNILGFRVDYQIWLSVDGGAFGKLLDASFNGKTTTKFERTHLIDLPNATTKWTIKVLRVTANSTSSYIQDKTYVESYTEIVNVKLRMPMSAVFGVVVDAKQFNNIPSRAYHLKGRIIKVPTNYDPVARTYSGVWDGTFKLAYTNNPAWVFYDMATHTRYGLGHLIDTAFVDKWALYSIGQYCDELVPDGFGGNEPRFTANLYLQTQADAYKVMQDMATMFRGIMYVAGGSIVACADQPSDPIYTYTPANVVGGRFAYSGSAKKVRHTIAVVSWNDMSDFGRSKVEYVEDPDGILRYGVQQTEVVAIGCTSRGQAHRLGKYILATERYETDAVSFEVGLDGTIPAPGRIINIADPLRAGSRTGGRLKAATINSVTPDVMPTVVVGNSVTVILPTGVPEKRTVSAVTATTISVSPDFSSIPLSQSVWMLETDTVNAARYRVLAVLEKTDNTGYTVRGIENVEAKYDYVDFGTIIDLPPICGVIPRFLLAPTGITITEVEVSEANIARKDLRVEWNQVAGAVEYQISYRIDSSNWREVPGKHTANSVDILNVSAGQLEVRIVAISSNGVMSQPAIGGPFTLTTLSVSPGYVMTLQDNIANAQSDATNALAQLSDIASDSLLTPGEKPVVIKDRDAIVAEQAGIDAQATTFGITTEKTAYDNAVTALTAYLATITTYVAWDNLTGKSIVNPTTFKQKFLDVYSTRQALLNAIYNKAKTLADNAQTAAQAAQSTANDALTDATNAQTDATNALNKLTDIASDNLLTAGEKPAVIRDRDAITGEQSGIDTQATAFGVTTEKTTYDNAVTALTTYLATLTSPTLWSTLTGDTTIVGTTFRQKFLDVYSARQALLNKIYAVAKGLADTAQAAADASSLQASSAVQPTKQFVFAGAVLPSAITNTRYNVAASADGVSTELTASAADPNLVWNVGLAPSKCYAVAARVRLVSGTWQGTCYYDNGTHSFSESYKRTMGAPKVGVWTTVVWDMRSLASGGTDFTASANIAKLRLDLVESSGAVIDVDWIAYGTFGQVSQGDVDAANTAVAAAQADATSALSKLADITSDNLLTAGEKPFAIRDRDAIIAEQSGIDTQATAYNVTAEKTTYDNAVTALTTYLATLTSPTLWTDLTGNTTIVGSTFRQKFIDVYSARTVLLQKIADLVTFGNLAGRGVNLMPDAYSTFEATTLPTFGSKSATVTLTRDAAVLYGGQPSLKAAATGVDGWFVLSANSTTYNIPVQPGKKYLFSFQVRCDQASKPVQVYCNDDASGGGVNQTPWTQNTNATANTWSRLTWVVAPSATATMMCVRIDHEGGAGCNMWFNQMQVEEIVGAQTTPSAYSRGTAGSAAIAANAAANAAQTAATNAQADATSALNQLSDISNDGLLTNNEKPVVIKDRDAIVAEQGGIDTKATAFGITTEKTTYDNAVTALTSYLATLTTPVQWDSLTGSTTIVGTTFRQKFLDVYSARQALLNVIYQTAKNLADNAQSTANAAQTAATNAQTDATSALNKLTDIASDSLLTPGEKPVVIKDRDAITGEQTGIDTQATAYGITTEKTTYDNSVTALTSYLATLTAPTLWSDLSGNTTIVGTTFRSKFTDVYSARQALLNAIYEAAQDLANSKVAAVGDNLIPNPSFVLNQSGVPAATNIAKNLVIADGWIVTFDYTNTAGQTSTTTDAQWHNATRPDGIYLGVNKPLAIANGVTMASQVRTQNKIPVKPGEQYLVSFSGQPDYNGTTNANVVYQARMSVQWMTAAGATVSTDIVSILSRTVSGVQNIAEKTLTAPSTAYSCYVFLDVIVTNNTGAAWTHDSTVANRWTFSSCYLVRKMSSTSQLPMLMWANGRAKVPTVISYTASAGSPATATITVAAFSIISGSRTPISYNSMSINLTHAAGSVQYYLYFDDPTGAGGTQTLVASLNGDDVYKAEGRVYVGDCLVTYPSSGTSSGGGGRTDSCVCIDMHLLNDVIAAEAEAGLVLDCIDLHNLGPVVFRSPMTGVEFAEVPCVELRCRNGAIWRGARTTPFDLFGGGTTYAPDMTDHLVLTDNGITDVMEVIDIGMQWVAHIHVHSFSYAAGLNPDNRVYSHNALKP